MPGLLEHLVFEVFEHFILNDGPLGEKVIGSVQGGGITNNVNDHSHQDALLLGSVVGVHLEDALWFDSVLQRSLKVQLQTVAGSALDHGQSGSGFVGELDGVDFDVILLESMAEADELDSMVVRFILNGLEPTRVVQAHLVVR